MRTADVEHRRQALAQLCEAYWSPLYSFVRRRGYGPDDAADLTQNFFAHVIEKGALAGVDPSLGRFRAFLLASIKNFLANEWDRTVARKRGGGWVRVPFEPPDLERRYVALRSGEFDPERLFDREWALTVLDRALARLRVQQAEAGKTREFDVLLGFLTSDSGEDRPYRDVAASLGMSEVAVRAAVHRLRVRFGTVLREEVSETVGDAGAADAELRHILALLST